MILWQIKVLEQGIDPMGCNSERMLDRHDYRKLLATLEYITRSHNWLMLQPI
jgi:hypothetical protein